MKIASKLNEKKFVELEFFTANRFITYFPMTCYQSPVHILIIITAVEPGHTDDGKLQHIFRLLSMSVLHPVDLFPLHCLLLMVLLI